MGVEVEVSEGWRCMTCLLRAFRAVCGARAARRSSVVTFTRTAGSVNLTVMQKGQLRTRYSVCRVMCRIAFGGSSASVEPTELLRP